MKMYIRADEDNVSALQPVIDYINENYTDFINKCIHECLNSIDLPDNITNVDVYLEEVGPERYGESCYMMLGTELSSKLSEDISYLIDSEELHKYPHYNFGGNIQFTRDDFISVYFRDIVFIENSDSIDTLSENDIKYAVRSVIDNIPNCYKTFDFEIYLSMLDAAVDIHNAFSSDQISTKFYLYDSFDIFINDDINDTCICAKSYKFDRQSKLKSSTIIKQIKNELKNEYGYELGNNIPDIRSDIDKVLVLEGVVRYKGHPDVQELFEELEDDDRFVSTVNFGNTNISFNFQGAADDIDDIEKEIESITNIQQKSKYDMPFKYRMNKFKYKNGEYRI